MYLYLMYLRKSRADRDFSDEPVMQTLQRHKKRLEEYCLSHDIIVPESNILYEVAGADSIASRPKMMELLSLVETGKYEGVLCVDMDRLSRGSGADQALVINTFKYSNTKIITPNKTYDFSDDMDEQFAELGLFMAKNEYRQIKKRLRQGKVDAVKEGKYPCSNAPFGYKTVKLRGQKGYSLEIVPEEADIVRLMFKLYTEENYGGHRVAKWLNENGYKTREGRPWLAAHVNKILRDPTYTGKVRFAHRVRAKVMRNGKTVEVERNNDENQLICDGLHEPIISEAVFENVKFIRSNHFTPHTRRTYDLQNPLCGVVKCEICGKGLALSSKDNHGRQLYCPTPGCPTVASYMDYVEEDILNWMEGWLEEYRMLPREESHKKDIKKKEKDIAGLKAELKAETAKQNKIYSFLEEGVYSTEEYKNRITESKKRISNIEDRMTKLESEMTKLKEYESQQASIAPQLETVVERYRTLSIPERNRMMRLIFDHIEYSKTAGGKGRGKDFKLIVFPRIPKYPQ